MEYAGLETLDGIPSKISTSDPKNPEEIIGSFVDEYVMLEFDVEKALRQQKEQARQNANTGPVTRAQRSNIQPGHIVALLQPTANNTPTVIGVGKVITPPPDIVTHPGTVLVYIAYVEITSPKTNMHHLNVGQFVIWQENLLALCGQNTASEENNKKQAQPEPVTKPEATMSNIPPQDSQKDDRVLNYGLQVIQLGTLLMQLHDTEKEGDGERNLRNTKLLMQCQIAPDYTRHTSLSKQEDEKEMINLVHSQRPFVFTAGRKHNSFPTVTKGPLDQLDIVKFDAWLTRHKRKLAACRFAGPDVDGDASDNEDEDDSNTELESDQDDNSSD